MEGEAVNQNTLGKLVENISEHEDEQAGFLVCYLKDRMCGPAHVVSRIRINVEGTSLIQEEPRTLRSAMEQHMQPTMARDLEAITEAAKRVPTFFDMVRVAANHARTLTSEKT